MNRGDIVLMDTNVIIEAHRTNCWKAVVKAFKVETVEQCKTEVATGDKRRSDYVVIDVEEMSQAIKIHPVSLLELTTVEAALAEPDRIDPGEKHLLAHALKRQPGVWHISAPDRGAVKAGMELGLLDRFISLETLTKAVGMTPGLKNQYTEKGLSALRMSIFTAQS